jgi:hypothetical protein
LTLIIGVQSAKAWGTGLLYHSSGCVFQGYSDAPVWNYSWSDTGAGSCSDATGVQIQYWTGSSWVYRSWVISDAAADYAYDEVGTQFMNGYHKIFDAGTWSSTYWTTRSLVIRFRGPIDRGAASNDAAPVANVSLETVR